jgi:hypothetical protein
MPARLGHNGQLRLVAEFGDEHQSEGCDKGVPIHTVHNSAAHSTIEGRHCPAWPRAKQDNGL